MNLYKRATNPLQYDAPDVTWSEIEYGLDNAGTRRFHFDYLRKYRKAWLGASVLDIGCGTGWLVNELRKNGAKAYGIDPSAKNIAMGRFLYPETALQQKSIQSLQTNKKFDIAIAVMVFNHIDDLPAAFAKVSALLNEKGELHLIVPDYHYFLRPRHHYKMEVEKINEQVSVAQAFRKEGAIADIVRTLDVYRDAVSKSGFEIVEEIPMLPSKKLTFDAKRFLSFQGQPIAHLLRIEKR